MGSPDFSLNLSPQTTTVAPGGSTNLMISASAVGGFNGQISLSCSTASGLTCAFNPSTISAGTSTPSTLTVSAAAAPPTNGYGMAVLLPGLGLFGMLLSPRKRKPLGRKNILLTSVLGLLLVVSLFTLGCGSSSTSSKSQTSASQVTLTVTGTSGAISHSTPLTININ